MYTDPVGVLSSIYAATTFWKPEAMCVVLGWLAWQALCYFIVPGPKVQGVVMRNGERLDYKINAFNTLVATVGVLVSVYYTKGLAPFLWVADNTLPLAVAAATFCAVQSLVLYLASFRSPNVLLAEGGNSGYPIYDYWMGRELNPRLPGGFDLKYICELRPGLIGWAVLNVCLAVKQYVLLGGRVTNSMALVVLFEAYYVVDALWNERAILTTMDITTDGFGFMLTFGDLTWVPFTYSLQALYLTKNPITLSRTTAVAIACVNLLGLYIFRSANSEKNAFRTDPTSPAVRHLKYIETKSGSRLLVSGCNPAKQATG
ncbi:hypothetical protein HK104_010822 [Borealophlyctis nickersoniae]|nr:hypothetical protein HK104_010822 [Borealophlyctis nickersoniae]